MWITAVPESALDEGRAASTPSRMLAGMEAGFVALYQKCVHLGCRVPHCATVAVVRVPVPRLAVQPRRREEGRPAPRGLDRFAATRRRRRPSPSTPATILSGPPIGTNTTGQEAEGPHCIGAGGGHYLRRPRTRNPTTTMTLATTASLRTVCRTIGLSTLFAIVLVATIVYVFVNVVFSGKAELGAGIELAANRKPYYDDEALEGDRASTSGAEHLRPAAGAGLSWPSASPCTG